MNVSAILSDKGRTVVTLSPEATLGDAARRLAEKKIGTVVVVDREGRVAGIISERDIIRRIGLGGPESLVEPVSESMSRPVVTCQEADTLDKLMAQMTRRRFRHLPVVENGRLVGIVSIGDVVKHHIAEVEMEAGAMRRYIAAAG